MTPVTAPAPTETITVPETAARVGITPRPAPAAGSLLRVLARWAAQIEADGIGAHEDRVRDLVAAASGRGLCPVLVDVLADPREPSAARERAFGRLALALTLR